MAEARNSEYEEQTALHNPDPPDDGVRKTLGPKPFVSMLLLMIGAMFAAVGQHAFYAHANGNDVETFFIPQEWVIRIGTGFAYVFQIVLVAAVTSAYAHRFWYSARRTALTVHTIDGLFTLPGNPFQILNFELLRKAKLLWVVAGIGYLIPVASILSPGALTVVNMETTTSIIANVSTVANLDSDVGFVEVGSAFTYLGPSNQLSRIATQVLTTGQVLPFPSPCGSNCTYNVTLAGPAYQCSQLDTTVPFPNLTDTVSFMGDEASEFEPDGVVVFYALEIVGNDTGDGLWVYVGLPDNDTITYCTIWNATYNSNVKFTDNIAAITTTVDLLSPLNASNITSSMTLLQDGDGLGWLALNTYAIQEAVSLLLQGYINIASTYGGYVTNETQVGIASWVDMAPFAFTIEGNVSQILESLLVNTTFSITNLLSGSTISNDLTAVAAQYTPVAALVTSYPAKYVYNRIPLWGTYGIALGLAGICSVMGGLMLWKNGMAGDLRFSHVVVTTRNPTLDKLCSGTGMADMKGLEHVRLRYGILPGDEPRLAFGTEDEIIPINQRK